MTQPSVLEWTAWPFRRKPGRGVFAIAFAAATIALVAAASPGPILPILAAVVLTVSLAPFFLPTRYVLDEAGVVVRRAGKSTRRPWNAFRRVSADDEMCLLSPFEKRHPLESFRGTTLLLNGNRRAVVDYAEAMVAVEERHRVDAAAGR